MEIPSKVNDIIKLFHIEDEVLLKYSQEIENQFVLGLEYGSPRSSIAMLPSYIPALPDGSEVGKYLAIDLSGINLRVTMVTLLGNHEIEQDTRNYMIPTNLMRGTGEQLFNFIINCLVKFLKELDLLDATMSIAFVFSYPCELVSIRSARLLWWTKGFDIPDCLQKDIVKLLEEALEMNMLTKVKVKAVMNDTAGQMAAAAYVHGPLCTMSVVIGYGCNSSYLEETKRIKKINDSNYKYDKMVIVTEWEEFGAKGEFADILTKYDKQIDEASVHKGKQMIDKLTGALYLGEIVRLVLIDLADVGLLFNGTRCEKLGEAESFPPKYVAEILSDEDEHLKTSRRVCDELEIPSHCTKDYEIMREVCLAISMRSAGIVAAAISALLRHMGQKKIKISIGGALIRCHPIYEDLLREKLLDLDPGNIEWELVRANQGSARGAAMVAAVAVKLNL